MPTPKMLEQTNGYLIYGDEEETCNCKICSHKIQPGEIGIVANPNITLYCCECFDKYYEKEIGPIPDDHFKFKQEHEQMLNKLRFEAVAVNIGKCPCCKHIYHKPIKKRFLERVSTTSTSIYAYAEFEVNVCSKCGVLFNIKPL